MPMWVIIIIIKINVVAHGWLRVKNHFEIPRIRNCPVLAESHGCFFICLNPTQKVTSVPDTVLQKSRQSFYISPTCFITLPTLSHQQNMISFSFLFFLCELCWSVISSNISYWTHDPLTGINGVHFYNDLGLQLLFWLKSKELLIFLPYNILLHMEKVVLEETYNLA